MRDADRLATKRRAQDRLLSIPGVHAVGLGPKLSGGKPTGELAIRVCVLEKKDLSRVPADEVIPPEIEGVKTDVVQSQPPKVLADEKKYRPLVGGVQLQLFAGLYVTREKDGRETTHFPPVGGTLGCFARTVASPARDVLVTVYHLLYYAPNKKGSKVGQPTPYGSLCCTDVVGTVLDGKLSKKVDAAIAALEPKVEWVAQIQDIGAVTGTATPTQEDALTVEYEVRFRGFKSGLKKGVLMDVDMSGTFEFEMGKDEKVKRTYDHQLEVFPYPEDNQSFTEAGDSGSALVNRDGQVIGILWGGYQPTANGNANATYGLGSPIADVESELGIKIATNPPAMVHVVPEPSLFSFIEPHVRRDALSSNGVRLYLHLFLRHQAEIRAMLDSNRRVALAWHRSHGPRLLQHVFEAIAAPDRPLPAHIGGSSWSDCVRSILDAFAAAGSADLREDVARHGTLLTRLGGLSYHQIVVELSSIDVTGGPAAHAMRR